MLLARRAARRRCAGRRSADRALPAAGGGPLLRRRPGVPRGCERRAQRRVGSRDLGPMRS